MKGYRNVYRCPKCKKVAKSKKCMTNNIYTFPFIFNDTVLCRHCGKTVKLEQVAAKPKLFGLLGWDIKEKE